MTSLNRQLVYLQQLARQHRVLVVFFEDADLKRVYSGQVGDYRGLLPSCHRREVCVREETDCVNFETTWHLLAADNS